GAVEGIEQQQVVAARVGVGNRVAVLHLLGRAGGEVAAPGVGLEQDLVADDVQLLLRLALDVAGAGIAEHAAERALADRDRDAGAGARDHGDQLAQVGVDATGALLLDQMAGEGDGMAGAGHGDLRSVGRSHSPACRPGSKRMADCAPDERDPDVTEDTAALLYASSAALGAGLLVGLVRERGHATPSTAGLRTHALVALSAAVAAWLGPGVLLVALAAVAVLAAMSYHASHEGDPGLTGEVALVATALLGALAMRAPGIATGLAVVVAVLLFAKQPLHTLTRELLSEREVFDGLFLLASALVVLPLLPDRGFGPYGALNPRTLWLLVVLVMAVGAVGHVALRVIGNRWGLAVSGFFAGYVSSTAAVLGFGQRAKESPQLMRSAVGAALLANLASLTLAVPVLGALSPALVAEQRWILAAVGAVLLAGGLLGLHAGREDEVAPPTAETRMFRFSHALGFAV